MKKQKTTFEGIYDLFAIRIILDSEYEKEKQECWAAYSIVTDMYQPNPKRLRDWLSIPKSNGYESLHTTVMGPEGKWVEVQIRTERMDEVAERGIAAHWRYKGVKQGGIGAEEWLQRLRTLLEDTTSESIVHRFDAKPATGEIFVFTPTGDIRKLPEGATVLDFAFDIHSGLGIKCTGGKINGKAVPIKEKLKTGDIVEIMSGKNQKPSADWLNFVVTNKARTKIKQKMSEAEFQKAADGKEILSRRLKNWKMEVDDETMAALLKKYQFKTLNAFYAAIGDETFDVATVKTFVQEMASQTAEVPVQDSKIKTGMQASKGNDDILVIDAKNVRGIDYRMARCCNPVFGDDVFGFVTRTEGIKIHRISCPNAARLLEMYPYRIQKVKWSETPSSGNFQTGLRVVTALEPSVINEIMDVVNSFRASIRMFNVTENDRQGTYDITMKIAVPSNLELDKVISMIRNKKNVLKINRM